MTAQVADSGDAGCRGRESREGREGRGEFAAFAQVEVDARPGASAAESVAAVDRETLGPRVTVAPKRGSRVANRSPTWVVSSGHPAIVTRAAGEQRRGEERAGVRQVGFDRDLGARDRSRLDDPGGGLAGSSPSRRAGRGSRSSSRCAAGSAAARPRGAARARAGTGAPRAAAPRRTGSTPRHRSSARRPRSTPSPWIVNGRRPRPSSSTVDPEGAQRVDRRRHRALAGVGVAVDLDRAVGEGRDRRDEAHDGSGEAGVDRRAAVQRPRGDVPGRRPVRGRGGRVDRHAESAERIRHQCRVASARAARERRRGVGESGEHEFAIRQALRTRDGEARVERMRSLPERASLRGIGFNSSSVVKGMPTALLERPLSLAVVDSTAMTDTQPKGRPQ